MDLYEKQFCSFFSFYLKTGRSLLLKFLHSVRMVAMAYAQKQNMQRHLCISHNFPFQCKIEDT